MQNYPSDRFIGVITAVSYKIEIDDPKRFRNSRTVGAIFTKANVDEWDVFSELIKKIKELLLGNKGYIRPELQTQLKEQGLNLETPLRENMHDKRPKKFLRWMVGTRRLVETVIGQLTERFHIEKVRARDLWHQFSRFWRKLLAHTASIKLSLSMKNKPLQFERLVCC